jgi:hypothetical protein
MIGWNAPFPAVHGTGIDPQGSSLGWPDAIGFRGSLAASVLAAGQTLSRSDGFAPCPVASDAENTFNHPQGSGIPWMKVWSTSEATGWRRATPQDQRKHIAPLEPKLYPRGP